jgi:two-component system, sensor histidine kinase PdtaS
VVLTAWSHRPTERMTTANNHAASPMRLSRTPGTEPGNAPRRRKANASRMVAERGLHSFDLRGERLAMGWIDYLARLAHRRANGLSSWALALAFFLAALAVRLALPPAAGRLPFVAFFPAIIAAVLACGFPQGAAILVLSTMSAWYLFLPPAYSFATSPESVVALIAFVLVGALLVVVVEGLALAIQKAEALALANADLFRELQHRVANNFQIVAATLQKARRGMTDPSAQAAIDTAVARIQAMASMHRGLYDAKSYARGLKPVLAAVVADVFQDVSVEVRIDVPPLELSIGEMTAITLLVNEAALNAAKHVFRQEKGKRFEVLLSELRPRRLELLIRDDGPGIPREIQSDDGRPRFGLTVMRSLAGQLGGSLEFPAGNAGLLRVEFPSGTLS